MTDGNLTLTQMLQHWTQICPDKEVFIFLKGAKRCRVLTVKEIYTLSGRFASRLRRNGLKPGDVVANAVSNSPERLVTEIGTVMAGCVAMNCVVCDRSGQEFWRSADLSQCKALILPDLENHAVFQILSPYMQCSDAANGNYTVSAPEAPFLRKAFCIRRNSQNTATSVIARDQIQLNSTNGTIDVSSDEIQDGIICNTRPMFMESLEKSEEEIYMYVGSPDDNAVIVSTSGTTGYTKLVAKTHKQLLCGERSFGDYNSTIVFLNDAPFGWLEGSLGKFYSNCSSRVLQDFFHGGVNAAEDYPRIWEIVEKEGCSVASIYPKTVVKIADMFGGQEPSFKIPILYMTGQPITKEIVSAGLRIADSVFVVYGTTELSGLSYIYVEDTVDFQDYLCGQIPDQVKIRIVDEHFEDIPQGKEGNILAKKPDVFNGYYNKSKSVVIESPFTSDGYFITGDRGKIDNHGNLYVYCRHDEVVNQHQCLYHTSFPERFLKNNPDVQDVIVIKIYSDPNGNDKLCACVVPKEESRLSPVSLMQSYEKSFFGVSEFGIDYPELKFFIFYKRFPVTYNGKPDRKQLILDARKHLQLKTNIDAMKDRMLCTNNTMHLDISRRVWDEFFYRFDAVRAASGGHIEHL